MKNKILFGITGSVSAFKTISLIRMFLKNNYECKAIVTSGAKEFIKPELLVALGCDIYTDDGLCMKSYEDAMAHINLPRWADKIIIVPASANSIAKFATGLTSDLLSQCILANDDNSKVFIAPSMNVNMWKNTFTQNNITTLTNEGFNIIHPDDGIQACGDIGSGRLHEPEQLFKLLSHKQTLENKKVLITLGATIEDIDGVRYLSNYSSGKMGISLVKELLFNGSTVVVLKAKTSVSIDFKHINLTIIDTISAISMNDEMLKNAKNVDIFIGCAAVSDYRVKDHFDNKIKKTSDTMTLEFIKNPDVLLNCTTNYPDIFAVGFAAESENLEKYATSKLVKKNLNLIVANSTKVFGESYTSAIIFSKDMSSVKVDHVSKEKLAEIIIRQISESI